MVEQKKREIAKKSAPFDHYRLIIMIIFLACSLFPVFASADADKPVVFAGVNHLEPLCCKVFNKDPGIVINFLRQVAKLEGWDLRIIHGSLKDIRGKLETNEIQLAAPIFYSEETAKRFEFSQESIISTWAQIYSSQQNSIQSLLDLADLSVGVKREDPYNHDLREMMVRLNLQCRFVEFTDYAEIFSAIKKGWINAGVVDRLFGSQKALDQGIKQTTIIFSPKELRFASPKNTSQKYLNVIDFHLNRQKKNPVSVYNRQISQLFGNPAYRGIPESVVWAISIIFGFMLISFVFVFILKREVRNKTLELVSINKNLKHEVRLRTEAEEKYRSVFENTGTATIILDKNSFIIMANEKAANLFGYSLQELENGMTAGQCITSAHRNRVIELFNDWRASVLNPSLEMEFQVTDKDGAPKDVLARIGRIPGFGASVASLIDITERKRRENELIQLATAVDQSSDSMAILSKDGKIDYVNPAFECMSGYSRDEVIGKKLAFLRSMHHDPKTIQSMETAMKEGLVWRGRLSNKRKDGELYITETTASPIRDKDGHIINYINIKRDVTMEANLEHQLRQSQKLQAIGQLAGGIAHDFNNILTSIMGNTELALIELKENQPISVRLENTLSASERAKSLINQILMFSRKQEQKRRPVQLNRIVAEAENLIRASAPATIDVQVNLTREPNIIMADATQVHQIVMNLCANAVHAMADKKGRLYISTEILTLSHETAKKFLELKPGVYVWLTVADTGRGIDAETRERIFEPFFTTKDKGEGTGMGLSVVHGIVKSHNGAIVVESEPGKGSSFQVFFPIAEQGHVEVQPQIVPEPAMVSSGRILVVDDEMAVTKVCSSMLRRIGYQVECTGSSKKALSMVTRAPLFYDLVVTDNSMPEMTGMELASKLLMIRPDLPIVLCTGYRDKITEKSAISAGIRGFLMKPYRMKELSDAVGRLMKESSGIEDVRKKEESTVSAALG